MSAKNAFDLDVFPENTFGYTFLECESKTMLKA